MERGKEDKIKELIPCYTEMKELPENLSIEDAENMFYSICQIREFEMKVKDLWRADKIMERLLRLEPVMLWKREIT